MARTTTTQSDRHANNTNNILFIEDGTEDEDEENAEKGDAEEDNSEEAQNEI